MPEVERAPLVVPVDEAAPLEPVRVADPLELEPVLVAAALPLLAVVDPAAAVEDEPAAVEVPPTVDPLTIERLTLVGVVLL